MKRADIILGGILILSAIGHAFGSYAAYKSQPMVLLWALCASLAMLLLGAVNLLRVWRPGDKSLALICLFGNLAWLAPVIAFDRLIGNPFDVRPILQGIAVIGLAVFSVRSALLARRA
ncbi:MAG TPA: hypothetical protein VMU48_05830 [Terracidiphilus sp.]|nr:hypothetical protein [Terracidiphilus sp.]